MTKVGHRTQDLTLSFIPSIFSGLGHTTSNKLGMDDIPASGQRHMASYVWKCLSGNYAVERPTLLWCFKSRELLRSVLHKAGKQGFSLNKDLGFFFFFGAGIHASEAKAWKEVTHVNTSSSQVLRKDYHSIEYT